MGREVSINFPPTRIISLVPSQTELLHDLGLSDEVIGITKFCVHPENWFRSKARIGGTKKLDLEKIRSLNPDLIIANKEENTQEEIEILSNEFPVWISDIQSLHDAIEMIQEVGQITNRAERAASISSEIQRSFSNINPTYPAKKVLYLIWKSPYMAAGRNTFINEMLEKCGFQNAVNEPSSRYPEISVEQISALNPELIFLSSEPFPFKGKHTEEIIAAFPNSKVLEVDGEYFSWYGSRLKDAAKYFESIIDSI